MYQLQYWVELQALRTYAYYLELYQLRSETIERSLSIFLAVTSSASVGGWAIWGQYAFVWGLIIMISQVVSVVYKFLPFKARIKPLSGAGVELAALADEAERAWFDVSQGELTEREIHEKRCDLRNKKTAIMSSAFSGISLPESKDLLRKAAGKTAQYFNSHYPEVDDDN
jgi:hypothetical protein